MLNIQILLKYEETGIENVFYDLLTITVIVKCFLFFILPSPTSLFKMRILELQLVTGGFMDYSIIKWLMCLNGMG